MYKRIAVAVDGSETSNQALDEAIKLAGGMGAAMLLIHVCEEPPMMWEPDGMGMLPAQDIMKAIADAGRALLEKCRLRVDGTGVAAETKLVEFAGGPVGSVISEHAREWEADLLVVGTHGRKGIEHFLMGSVAEGVIRTATMPVLLVRSPE